MITTETDKKILFELHKNSRQSDYSIAKTLKLNEKQIQYKRAKMEENRVIKSYYTEVDFQKLGFNLFLIKIKIEDELEKIIDYLKTYQGVLTIATTLAEYCIETKVAFKTIDQISEFENTIRKFSKAVSSIKAYLIKKEDILLKSNFNSTKQETKIHSEKLELLTENQKKVLKEILNDSKKTLIQISKNTGLVPKTVSKIIIDLKKREIINCFRILIDIYHEESTIFITELKNKNDLLKKLEEIKEIDEVTAIREFSLEDTTEVTLECKSIEHFKAVMNKMQRIMKSKIHYNFYPIDELIQINAREKIFDSL